MVKVHEVKYKKLHKYTAYLTYNFGVSIVYVTVPQHYLLSKYTKLEGPSTAKWNLFPTTWPLHDFQGSIHFHGHGFWSVCKLVICPCVSPLHKITRTTVVAPFAIWSKLVGVYECMCRDYACQTQYLNIDADVGQLWLA